MKDYRYMVMQKFKISILKDYLITSALSDLEERIKRIEENLELDYRTTPISIYYYSSPVEEYKRMEIPFFSETDPQLNRWNEELAFWNSNKMELLKNATYRNKFIAIKDGKIIDYDMDKFRLVKRVNSAYPNQVVLVVRVERGMPVAEIPSPEVSL